MIVVALTKVGDPIKMKEESMMKHIIKPITFVRTFTPPNYLSVVNISGYNGNNILFPIYNNIGSIIKISAIIKYIQ